MNPYLLIALVCLWALSLVFVAHYYKRQVKQMSLTCALLAHQREEALRGRDRQYIVSLYEDWKRACAINDDALDQNLVGLVSGRIPTPLPGDGVDA